MVSSAFTSMHYFHWLAFGIVLLTEPMAFFPDDECSSLGSSAVPSYENDSEGCSDDSDLIDDGSNSSRLRERADVGFVFS